MQFLKANTQVKVVVGPFVDVGDGFTPETGITLGAADEAEAIKHDAGTVTDISAATWAAITSADGYYNLTMTTSHTDTEGLLTVVVQDDSVCLPVKAQFMVVAEAAYDSLFAAKDTGYMDINVKAISEDAAAADTLEASCDTINYCTAIAGGSSTTVLCTTSVAIPALVAQADQYNARQLLFIDGDLQGVQRQITDYSESAGTATFTVATFPGTPDTPGVGDKFIVF